MSNYNVEEVHNELMNKIKDFSIKRLSNYDISRVYSENYYITNMQTDDFSALIPIYVIKIKKNVLYNVPGIHINKHKKKIKKTTTNQNIIIAIAFIIGLFFLINSIYPLAIITFTIVGIILFYTSNSFTNKEYYNFTYHRKLFGAKRKKLR